MAKQYNLSQYSFKRKQYEVPKIDLRKKDSYDIKELNAIRCRLAKVANQRLRGIEAAGETEGYVYSQSMVYLINKNRARFIESNRQLNIYELKDELEELNAFLRAKTSTIGGIRKYQRDTATIFKEKFGVQLRDPVAFTRFLSSEQYKKVVEQVGSEFLVEFYDRAIEAQVNVQDILDALDLYEKGTIDNWGDLYRQVGLEFVDYL